MVGLGFDSHEMVAGLSGSSKPTYWNVGLWFEAWYEFVMMVWISVNSDGVRGSSGWGWPWRWGWLVAVEREKIERRERMNIFLEVEGIA